MCVVVLSIICCIHILTIFPDTVWAALWAFVYRKFFWDFVSGTLRNPGGLQYVHFGIAVKNSRR